MFALRERLVTWKVPLGYLVEEGRGRRTVGNGQWAMCCGHSGSSSTVVALVRHASQRDRSGLLAWDICKVPYVSNHPPGLERVWRRLVDVNPSA